MAACRALQQGGPTAPEAPPVELLNPLFSHSLSSQVIGKRVPPDQLMSLLLAMFEGLADPDKNCSRAATVMINALLKERGAVLQDKVSPSRAAPTPLYPVCIYPNECQVLAAGLYGRYSSSGLGQKGPERSWSHRMGWVGRVLEGDGSVECLGWKSP